VLKALGIAHKTEANAVRLNLQNEQALSQAFAELKLLSDTLYIESMVEAVTLTNSGENHVRCCNNPP